MSKAFVEYVGSYSGLEDLKLYVPNSRWSRDPTIANHLNEHADVFWGAIERNHWMTLRHLDLISRYEGEWCFSRNNASTLRQCRKLVTLKIGVYAS